MLILTNNTDQDIVSSLSDACRSHEAAALPAFTRAFVKAAPGRDGSLRRLVFVLVSSSFISTGGATMAEREREKETGEEGARAETLRQRKFITSPQKSLVLVDSLSLYTISVCER